MGNRFSKKSPKNSALQNIILTSLAWLLTTSALIASSSCAKLIQSYYGYVRIVITEYNSGPVVKDATVILDTKSGRISKKSNDSGMVIFENLELNSAYKIEIQKEGYANTVIDILSLHSSINLNTTLRKPKFDPAAKSDIQIGFSLYDSEMKGTKYVNDKDGVYRIVQKGRIYIEAWARGDNVKISHMYAKLGNPPGAEALTSPRIYNAGDKLNGTIDTSPFNGKTYLFIDAYDENDNRYEIIVPLYFIGLVDLRVTPYYVEYSKPAIYGYNINSQVKYYNNASKYSNSYVVIKWKKWEESSQKSRTDKPVGYAVYRSFDGKKFSKIATVNGNMNMFIDSSGEITYGKRIWYAVSSVYGSFEASKTTLGSVIVLPLFGISNVQPADNSVDVSTTPVFSWNFVGLEEYDGLVTYWYDIWLYDMNVNKKYHYPVNSEGQVIFKSKDKNVRIEFSDYSWYNLPDKKLQANKPYEWGPELIAAIWEDETNNSISTCIVCDYNGVISVSVIPPEKYYLFVTKGE